MKWSSMKVTMKRWWIQEYQYDVRDILDRYEKQRNIHKIDNILIHIVIPQNPVLIHGSKWQMVALNNNDKKKNHYCW